MGYCPQSQAFWIWDGEVTKLKWSGYIVIGCRAGCFESAKDSAGSAVRNHPQNVKKYAGTLLNRQKKKKKLEGAVLCG